MPIMRMVSLIRDSFSRTSMNTVLYRGGMKTSKIRNGRTPVRMPVIGSVSLKAAGVGADRSEIRALLTPVVLMRATLAARLCRVEYPRERYYSNPDVSGVVAVGS